MRRLFTTLLVSLALNAAWAQDGELLEYQQEIGGGLGISSYLGDAGGGFMTHPGMMGTAIWRRNINPRMVVKANAAVGHISGNTEGVFIPNDPLSRTAEGGTASSVLRFSRNLVDVGAQFEFNFLGYGLGESYKGLSRWTPYMMAGVGFTMGFGGGAKVAAGMNIPLGVGFKYKLKPRLNIGLEWSFRFTTSDHLDDPSGVVKLSDPLGIESGMFKNKDCYQMLFVYVTYDISPKYRKCNN